MIEYAYTFLYMETGVTYLKLITFAVPCYNSEAYMDHCIQTLLHAGDEGEIILVDDGSTDGTGAIADGYAREHPGVVRVIHQANGGHGEGVNQGIAHAEGLYFYVVDSDDWLNEAALDRLLEHLRSAARMSEPVDLYLVNYVYEHVSDSTERVVRYKNALPVEQIFGWEDLGRFKASQFLTMHSVVYRTEVLRRSGLKLPKHTFYVDNLFVYQPLPSVKTLYYIDCDLYRYFIGRDDQSVTEENLIRRIDQQILVTQRMIDAHDLGRIKKSNPRLAEYMYHYLSMLLMICTIYLLLSGTDENLKKSKALWNDLRERRPALYRRMQFGTANIAFLLPGKAGRKACVSFYKLLRKIYKFN